MAVLVVAQALPGGGVHRRLRRPLTIEALLGLAGGPHAEQAAEPEPASGQRPARGAHDAVGDRRRGEDLVGGRAAVAAVVDEQHSPAIVLFRNEALNTTSTVRRGVIGCHTLTPAATAHRHDCP